MISFPFRTGSQPNCILAHSSRGNHERIVPNSLVEEPGGQALSKAVAAARWVGFLAITLIIFLFHLPAARDSILIADSGDYMRAAQSPLLSTWLNTDSASPPDLLHLRHGNPDFRQHPWDYLYAVGDKAALRHFHVPLSFYAMHIVRSFATTDSSTRLLASAVAALACGILFLILASFAVPLVPAALLALYAGVQSRYLEVSVAPYPHGWYILFALVFLYCFARFLLSHRSRDLYLTAIALGLAFATLEFTVELFASAPLALGLLWFSNRALLPRWNSVHLPLLKACGIFLATTFVLWPGGWLRGGYLESYGVLSATVLFKNKSAFGEHLSAGLIYRTVFAHHVIFLIVTLTWIVAATWLLLKRRLSIPSIVFSSYTLFAFALGLADHFRLDTYVSEFAVFLIASVGLVCNDLAPMFSTRTVRRATLVLACMVVAIGCVSEWSRRNQAWTPHPWLAAVFSGIEQRVPPGQTLLVTTDREALGLYLPRYHIESTLTETSPEPRSPERTASAHYCLFDSTVPLPANARVIAVYPGPPGESKVLCEFP